MKRTYHLLVVTVFVFSLCQLSFAKDIPEHPVIKPYPGSVLAKNMSKYQKFGESEFTVFDKVTKKKNKVKVQGQFWQMLYEVRTPDGKRVTDISRVEFFENYKNAAREAGGEVMHEDVGYLHFRIPKQDGGYTWCRIGTNAKMGQVYMRIVDEKGFKQSIIFGADELKQELDKNGKVLIYGILFDVDRANLKQESEKQLSHIVSLMLNYPDLNIEIQGHTDDQGKEDYNMTLSQERSETVKVYLKLFGIQDRRLKAKGYGESRPVTSNATEDGRAQNRRVELIKY